MPAKAGAFAKVRQQFKISIGEFESVQEASSDIASDAYMLEAFRYLVTCGLNQGGKPAVMTAMAKYYATETMRKVVNHSMDIVGGRAVQLGPRNFLALYYQAIPVSITVEGANILSRSLMIFGQGSMRCHPYLFEELQLLQAEDKDTALKKFNDLLFQHLGHTFNRAARALAYALTGGSSDAPEAADEFSLPYYKKINRFSADFALTADMCLGLHGKKTEAEQSHAQLALEKALYKVQEAFDGLFDNFPIRFAAGLIKRMCFPFRRAAAPPSDRLKRAAAEHMMQNNAFRQELTKHVHYSLAPHDVSGRMENAFLQLLNIEPLWDRFKKAEAKGQFKGLSFEEHIADAIAQNALTQSEAEQLTAYNIQRYDSMLTDIFDMQLLHELELSNPHLPADQQKIKQQHTDDSPEAFLRY